MEFKLLRRIPFLSTLPERDLRRVYKIARETDLAAGQAIFTKAEAADHMFIVISGRVKIFTRSASKKRKTFAYLKKGDFFGEMGLLEGLPRSASASAVEPSRLLLLRKADFKRLLISDPKLAYFLLQTVCARLRQANEEIEGLLFRNILGRVSKTLNDLSRGGRRFRGGVLLSDHFTQQELADLVGTTREPLSRALSSLRRAQLIDTHHGHYFIKDAGKLSALCLAAA
jgi:CRP-like cAMP-binding protein